MKFNVPLRESGRIWWVKSAKSERKQQLVVGARLEKHVLYESPSTLSETLLGQMEARGGSGRFRQHNGKKTREVKPRENAGTSVARAGRLRNACCLITATTELAFYSSELLFDVSLGASCRCFATAAPKTGDWDLFFPPSSRCNTVECGRMEVGNKRRVTANQERGALRLEFASDSVICIRRGLPECRC